LKEFRINQKISSEQVRLIDENGEQAGIVDTKEAMDRANEMGLDLVEISPAAKPPVAKIINYDKFRYEQELKVKKNRQTKTANDVKEVKFRLKIDVNDFNNKVNQIKKFLGEGAKVKISIMFRGRELQHPEFGYEKLQSIAESFGEEIVIEQEASGEGRNISMLIRSAVVKADTQKKSKEKDHSKKVYKSKRLEKLAARSQNDSQNDSQNESQNDSQNDDTNQDTNPVIEDIQPDNTVPEEEIPKQDFSEFYRSDKQKVQSVPSTKYQKPKNLNQFNDIVKNIKKEG
jgi:translation initiation factor IF-3